MKLYGVQVCSSPRTAVLLPSLLLLLPLLFCIETPQPASGQELSTPISVENAPLTIHQVVDNLVEMNLERAKALHAYHGTRIYRVEYRGFPGARNAEMVVDVKYQGPGTKEFTIQSATGSKIIIDKVFKKLLEAEQEDLTAEAQRRTALNRDNYNFAMVGYESTPFGSMYVLIVGPKTKG
jgi:hypothetical protein